MKDYFTIELQEKKTGKVILFKLAGSSIFDVNTYLRAHLQEKLYKIVSIDYSMN